MSESAATSKPASQPSAPIQDADSDRDIRVGKPVSRDEARSSVLDEIRRKPTKNNKPKKQTKPAEPEDTATESDETDDAPAPSERPKTRRTEEREDRLERPKAKKPARREVEEDPDDTEPESAEREETETDDEDAQPRGKDGRFAARDEDEDEGDEDGEEPEPKKPAKALTLEESLGLAPGALNEFRQQQTTQPQQGAQSQPSGVQPAAPSANQPQTRQAPQTPVGQDWGIKDDVFDELDGGYLPPEAAKGLRELQQVVREQDEAIRRFVPALQYLERQMQAQEKSQREAFQKAASGFLDGVRAEGLTTFGRAGESINQQHPAYGALVQLEQVAVSLWDKTGRDPSKAKQCLEIAAAIVDTKGMEGVMARRATKEIREKAERRQKSIDPVAGGLGTRGSKTESLGRDGARDVIRSMGISKAG